MAKQAKVVVTELEVLMKSGHKFSMWVYDFKFRANFKDFESVTEHVCPVNCRTGRTQRPLHVCYGHVEAILYTGYSGIVTMEADGEGDADIIFAQRSPDDGVFVDYRTRQNWQAMEQECMPFDKVMEYLYSDDEVDNESTEG